MADKGRVKVVKGGPYQVSGGLPLTDMVIVPDSEGVALRWRSKGVHPEKENYTLCRCGQSKNKPYCDGSHIKAGFVGEETADRAAYIEGTRVYDGPKLKLTDKRELCIGAGFCTRAGNIWNLTTNSDNPEHRKTAIQEAADCPSGRLVEWDKKGKALEPKLKSGIGVTEDQDGVAGPLWVMGGIDIEASDGYVYEKRNRVTLCRCGKSEACPLCDGSHLGE